MVIFHSYVTVYQRVGEIPVLLLVCLYHLKSCLVFVLVDFMVAWMDHLCVAGEISRDFARAAIQLKPQAKAGWLMWLMWRGDGRCGGVMADGNG